MTHELIIDDNPTYSLSIIYDSEYERFTAARVEIKGEYQAMFKLSDSELRILSSNENYDKLHAQIAEDAKNDAIRARIDAARGK